MKLLPLIKRRTHLIKASVLIASLALYTWATGQTVYKCGNSYSQTPCLNGEAVPVDDARDAKQKKQTDEAVQQDTKQAELLEKARLAQEKSALKSQANVPVATPAATPSTQETQAGVVHKITPKRIKTKLHKPDAFVAQVPDSVQKKSVKKVAKKKTVQKAASSPV